MAKIREIIKQVDLQKPNAFPEEGKLRWIAQLDGKIAQNVLLMGVEELQQFNYRYPEDLDTEPLVGFPHEDLYLLWLEAQIDAGNGEWNRYQNTVELYNAAYGNYVEWFANTYRPAEGCGQYGWVSNPNVPQYYITAYGLAVKAGYSGSLDDWLQSLVGPQGEQGIQGEKGEKGEKGDPGAKLQIGKVETLPAGSKATASIGGTAQEPVLNLGIPEGLYQVIAKAGFICPLVLEIVPDGFLLCDGAEYSRTEYPELFDMIGEKYGAGDGSTTFNVPDLSTRVPVGAGDAYTEVSYIIATGKGTNAGYAVSGVVMKDVENSISENANAVGPGCVAGAKAYQIIDKGAMDTLVNGRRADGYYLLCADEVPIEKLTGQDYSITIQSTYELAGKIVGVGQIETGLTGIDGNGNPVSGLTGFKVYVTGYKDDVLLDNTSQHWNETRNTFRIPYLPHLGTKDYGKGAWAEGLNTMAVAPGAYAGGSNTKALGKYGHSEGLGTVSLYCGHSEGAYTEADYLGHSEGYYTKAKKPGSHSEGAYTKADGDYSHTGGMFTQTHYEAQTAIGRYNLNKQDTLFEVGVGSGEFDRVNGLEVKKDGSARVLTESTEPDAVVRYSQLERTAVGFTNVVDTAISLDFEADPVGQTPAGWTEVTPSTDPAKYYVKVEDDSGNQVLRVNSVNAPGADYFVQYSLPEKVTNLKLEYRVMLRPNSPTAYELYLPTINYAGVATNRNNKFTPLRLWANDGNRLYYSFTDASAKVQMPGTYGYTRWYNIKMEVDLRAGTRTLAVGTDSETLAQLMLPMTEAEAADWSTATLDRISTGAFALYGGSLLLDDIKLSWERKSEICALTYVKDGEVYQLYPETGALPTSGCTMTGAIDMGGFGITNLGPATSPQSAINLQDLINHCHPLGCWLVIAEGSTGEELDNLRNNGGYRLTKEVNLDGTRVVHVYHFTAMRESENNPLSYCFLQIGCGYSHVHDFVIRWCWYDNWSAWRKI